jgi:hypothetical protein
MTASHFYEGDPWFSVRCIFRSPLTEDLPSGTRVYEERITLWRAPTFDDAIRMAEDEAQEYVRDIEYEYVGLAQAYVLPDEPGHGAEVYSLLRESRLPPSKYLNRFFDTGAERQGQVNGL